MEIHIVIRRINPALKIDFVQIGHIKDGQFESLSLSAIANPLVVSYLKSSSISDSLYIDHSEISSFIRICSDFPDFHIDFFDNTLVLMSNFEYGCDESSPEEKRKRD